MLDAENKKSVYFTDRKKGFFALGALAIAALWTAGWYLFPMEYYSIFFASTVGCYVLMLLLALVLSILSDFIFTKLTGSGISLPLHCTVNTVFMMGIFMLYSAAFLLFEKAAAVLLIALAVLLHTAATIFVFGSARMKPSNESKDTPLKAIKKQPIKTIVWAVVHTAAINAVNILLLSLIVFTFYEG